MSGHEHAIKITQEFATLVPKLSPQEYESLQTSIKVNGLLIPLIVNQNGVLLDGYHRYRACQELGIKPQVEAKIFPGPLEEKLFVINVNLKRRQLTNAQKVELGESLKPIYKELARRNSLSNLRQNSKINGDSDDASQLTRSSGSNDPLGRVNDIIAKEVGLSRMTYQRGETVLKRAPEIWNEQVRVGKITINKAYSVYKRTSRKEDLLKSAISNNNYQLPQDTPLIQGDFVEKSRIFILDNSIDLIFTDPPYGREWLPLYKDLAKVASRVLKSGASLVTNVGHCIIPDVIEHMESTGLMYWWPIAVKLMGPFNRSFDKGVSIKWKPLLWFVKGEKRIAVDFISDYIESRTPEKVLHEWEQGTEEAEHVISRLTVENEIVCDPLLGSGTTGVAALNLGRKFIGFEKDKEKFEIAKGRISKCCKKAKEAI